MDSNDSVDRAVPELDSHDWFAALDVRHQALLRADSTVRHYEAGAFITRRGEPSAHWIGVHTGLIKLAVYNADGRGATFSGVPAGGWCGEGSVLKRELRRYDVVAVRASTIILVPVDLFHLLLAESLSFNAFVIRQLNERMGQFIATIQNQRLLAVDAQVAQAIAQLFHPMLYPRTSSVLELSQEEIGLLTGISRQRVNQALGHLAELKLISIAYQAIRVVDLDGLRRYGVASL
ncbi:MULTISPECIES: Crp/Fnr family transcriptional regulator [unclassified Janthinobacterium]|uniref:Crp/Fnr family transcriptional regulator n=1 Tax=unclassified Janthinobacterium TaxID=2610881 RepID=UPI002590946D|nr:MULTISPECIES: Crp/Fnr family transcriptional regulator [unclassified Janthinobacterium]MCX7290734.1 Crp/Fnr family transcriptional regulator [Janthinobacterium sp.]MED5596584.1 Crp/Fnr family transcriptional regulator [Janthinobacterium sp. P210006]